METQIVKIFISYAHEDKELLELLKQHLKGHLIRHQHYEFQIWDDNEIAVGQDWESQINTAIDESSVCILLISSFFASSKYCTNKELTEFITKSKEKRAIVFPILIRSFSIENIQSISSKQFFTPDWSDYDKKGEDIMPFDEIVEPVVVDKYVQKYCDHLADKIKEAVVKNKLIIKSDSYSVREGKILHNIPDEMQLEKVVSSKIKIAFDEKLLRKDIEASDTIAKSLEVVNKMAVSLKPLRPGDFEIYELSPEHQELVKHAATEWTFSITPKRLGTCPLHLEGYVVNESGERVTIGFEEDIKVLTSTSEAKDGFKDTGKKVLAYFPLNWNGDKSNDDTPDKAPFTGEKSDHKGIGGNTFWRYAIPITLSVGALLYFIVPVFFQKPKDQIVVTEIPPNPVKEINSSKPDTLTINDIPIVPPQTQPTNKPVKPTPPVPTTKPPVHTSPAPVPTETKKNYKIKINSDLKYPILYVNNKAMPFSTEKGNKYVNLKEGSTRLVLFDSLNQLVCKSVTENIQKDMTIRFDCEKKISYLTIEIQDTELKGNKLLGFKTFKIDNESYQLRTYYDISTDKIKIPKPSMGLHSFELGGKESFCKQTFELKVGTELIKIRCLQKDLPRER